MGITKGKRMDDNIDVSEINEENINNLYNLAKGIEQHIEEDEQNGRDASIDFGKDGLIDMVISVEDFGVLNSTVKNSNALYASLFENERQNPFIIGKNKGDQYNNMDENNEEEIVANEVVIANRLAKIAEAVRKSIVKNMSMDDKHILKRLSLKHGVEEIEEIEFLDNDSSLKKCDVSKRGVKFKGTIKADGDIQTYDDYEDWFLNDAVKEASHGRPNGISASDIPVFQRYAKLMFCETMFYKAKAIAINKCIELSKKADPKIRVSDASRYDDKLYEERKLIQIDLPGYNAPILAHVSTEILDEPITTLGKEFEYSGNPIWSFRMTKEQREFIRKLDAVELWGENDEKYKISEHKLAYMQATDKWARDIRKKEKKIKEIKENRTANEEAKEKNKVLNKQKAVLETCVAQKENTEAKKAHYES